MLIRSLQSARMPWLAFRRVQIPQYFGFQVPQSLLRLRWLLPNSRGFATKKTIPLEELRQFKDEEIAEARQWLRKLDASKIPRHEFTVEFSRSSGPGGQKVNKTSSKATLKMPAESWQAAAWIPQVVKYILSREKLRYSHQNGIIIQCDTSRNREENARLCLQRLAEEIRQFEIAEPLSREVIARQKKQKARANEARLLSKKIQSEKKKSRSARFFDY